MMSMIILFFCFSCCLCWNQFGGSATGNFRSSYAGSDENWEVTVNGTVDGSNIIITSEGLVVIQAASGVYFVDGDKGNILGFSQGSVGEFGRFDSKEAYFAMPTTNDGGISLTGIAVLNNKDHGSDPWIYSDAFPPYSTVQNIVTAKNDMIIVKFVSFSSKGNFIASTIYGIQYPKKEVQWKLERLNSEDCQTLSVSPDGFLYTFNTTFITKIDPTNGKIVESFQFSDQPYLDTDSNIVFADEDLFFQYGDSGFGSVHYKENMSKRWLVSLGDIQHCNSVALSNDYSYAYLTCFHLLDPDVGGIYYLFVMDTSSGKIVNRTKIDNYPGSPGNGVMPGLVVTKGGTVVAVFQDDTYYFNETGCLVKREKNPEGLKGGLMFAADSKSLYRCCNSGYQHPQKCFKTKV